MPQEETVTAFLADQADQLLTQWTRIVRTNRLNSEDVTCTLNQQRDLANSLHRKASDELLLVTVLRRGSDSPSSRRQASTIFRLDTGIAS